jgi:hypothetical protein
VLRARLFTEGAARHLRSPASPTPEGPPDSGRTLPWWPPHKVMGAHLAPYLATHGELLETVEAP